MEKFAHPPKPFLLELTFWCLSAENDWKVFWGPGGVTSLNMELV